MVNKFQMNFESIISIFNENYFFKEFTYSRNLFRDNNNNEHEAGDCIVSLDEIMLIFQIKERNLSSVKTANEEIKWFKKKVIILATQQLKDTFHYLNTDSVGLLKNHRGHKINLSLPITPLKIVLYKASNLLPDNCKMQKYHQSKTIGIIHLIETDNYQNIVQTLITPAEIAEYFMFREKLIEKWKNDLNCFEEKALIGQYLSGNHNNDPSSSYIKYFESILHDTDEWNILGLLHVFQERLTYTTSIINNDYYFILKEIAKLQRHELREFKIRFEASVSASREDQEVLPYRMAVPRLDCGFIFIPMIKKYGNIGQELLEDCTILHKYDQRLSKYIGVTISADETEYYSVIWCYINYPWVEDCELDSRLKAMYPFRKANFKIIDRYKFK